MDSGKKNRKFEHIGAILPQLLKDHRPRQDAALIGVWDLWDTAVGDPIAQNARPAAFKGNLLLVHVTSSTWMHQLRFVKADLIQKLNLALGKDLIKEIKFKIGAF